MKLRKLLTTAALLLLSSPVHASGDGEPGWTMVILHAVNLAILLFLIIKLAGKPIRHALEARADSVGKDIEEAARLHAEAKAMLEDYEAKIASLEAEKTEIIEGLRAQGEAEKARVIEEAKADAERIRRDAERGAQNELERARETLEAEVVERAIEAAEQVIREKLTPADHRRLTGDYLSALEERGQA